MHLQGTIMARGLERDQDDLPGWHLTDGLRTLSTQMIASSVPVCRGRAARRRSRRRPRRQRAEPCRCELRVQRRDARRLQRSQTLEGRVELPARRIDAGDDARRRHGVGDELIRVSPPEIAVHDAEAGPDERREFGLRRPHRAGDLRGARVARGPAARVFVATR